MTAELRSILVGTAGLSAAFLFAVTLSIVRRPRTWSDVQRAVIPAALLTIAVQALHAAEEFATGFHLRFPATLGLVPWPPGFFGAFNVFWLAIWVASVWGLRARWRSALSPLWFLGIAGAVNGIAHPVLAVGSGGYYPGRVTAPFVGAAGVVLLRHLTAVTSPEGHDLSR